MRTLAEVPRTLTAELVERLGQLADQPDGVAEVALSVLRYGSRASLISHKVIEPVATKGDAAIEIVVTEYGHALIQACAAHIGNVEQQRREAEFELAQARDASMRESAQSRPLASRRPQRGSGEVPSTLTTALVRDLALLAGQPDGVAETALSVLPYDSRASLVDHGVIEPVATEGDAALEIVITRYGRELIAAAAAQLSDDEPNDHARRQAQAELDRAYAQSDRTRDEAYC
jgi:hypothetical protein